MKKTLIINKTNVKVDVVNNLSDIKIGKCFVMGEPFETTNYSGVAVEWTRVYTKKEKGIYYSFKMKVEKGKWEECELTLESQNITDALQEDGEKYITFDEKDKHLFKEKESYGHYYLKESAI